MNSITKNSRFYYQSSSFSILLLILLFIGGCGRHLHKSPIYLSGYLKVDFCNLMGFKDEVVYTQGVYAGVDEYWSFNALHKSCGNINADLDIPPDVDLKPKHERLLKQVHENYHKTYLVIDAIGKLETGSENGYGHLGTNNARFTVKEIINIQLIEIKK